MGFEVVTMDDKVKRNMMFDQLRKSDRDNERQVIKFSGYRPLLNPEVSGEIMLDSRGRIRYTSTWSVAYPIDC